MASRDAIAPRRKKTQGSNRNDFSRLWYLPFSIRIADFESAGGGVMTLRTRVSPVRRVLAKMANLPHPLPPTVFLH
jgi:hypothetical protein